jgi:hypothetical protein
MGSEMDWKQFIASLVNSVAWPAMLAFFLWLIRERIGTLLSRMIELHLPGGAKAVFTQELDRGREALEKIDFLGRPEIVRRARTRDSLSFEHKNALQASNEDPQWVILQAYNDVETHLNEARDKLGLSARMPYPAVIKGLVNEGYVEGGAVELFDSLRRGRNAVVHASSREVTVAEAVEYQIQAAKLSLILGEATKKLTLPKQGQ